MFQASNWVGLWCCLTIVCGYTARRLAIKHREKQEEINSEVLSDDDDDDMLYLEKDAEEISYV
tara:strand:- start:40 stop:228 length:189 start_codon:yes stop_codon:yes gene_type:complete